MLFVDAHKFKNKSNKSAIFAQLKFYEFPILLEWEVTIVNSAKFNFFIWPLWLTNILLII